MAVAVVEVAACGGMAANGAVAELLRRIRSAEGSYTSINRGRAGDTPGGMPSLTSMSVGQVMEMQRLGEAFAVGAYQFIPETLRGAVQRSGTASDERFSPEVQDRLALELILGGSKRPQLAAYLKGQSGNLNAAERGISNEWAGVKGPSGRGAYDGDSAGNYASVSVRDLLPLARQEVMNGGGGFDDLAASQFGFAEDARREEQRAAEEARRLEIERYGLNERRLELDAEGAAIGRSRLEQIQIEINALETVGALAAERLEFEGALPEAIQNSNKAIENQINALKQERRNIFEGFTAEAAGGTVFDPSGQTQELSAEMQRIKDLSDGIGSSIGDGIVGGLRDVVAGTRSVKDVFADLFASIADNFLSMAAQMLTSQVAGLIFGAFGGGIGGGGGFSPVSSLGGLGFGSGGAPLSFGGFLAKGGPAKAGKSYIVGEEGPELFVPGVSGAVVSTEDTQEAAAEAMGLMVGEGDDAGFSGAREATGAAMAGMAGKGGEAITREMMNVSSATSRAISNMATTERERERTEKVSQMVKESGSVKVNYNGPILRFNNEDYVKKDDVPRIISEGGKRGKSLVAKGMKGDPAFRKANR